MTLTSPLIAVGNGRGGGGKSTVANALAGAYVRRFGPLRVALVDLDAQASASTYLGGQAMADPLHAPQQHVHGIRLYPGGQGMAFASLEAISDHIHRASRDVDVVVVDLPPALAHASHAAVLRHPGAQLLIVAQLEPGAIQPALRLAELARHAQVPIRVFGNRLRARRALPAAIQANLRIMFEQEMLEPCVGDESVAMESIVAGVPLTHYRPKAPAARVLAAVADAILDRGAV